MAFAALVVGAASCAKDRIVLPETANGEATLVFSCGDIQTKTAGVNNENKVNKIDWFIFPYKADGIQIDSTAAPLLSGTIEPAATARLNKSYTKTLNATELAEVFPEADSKAFVFAVANYTGAYPESITLNGLLETKVRSTFADGDRWPHPLQTTDESLYFVMTGSAELTLSSATEVQLARLASKVTVAFTYEESIPDAHDANLVWKPQYNGPEARVYLSNAIATATLGGPLNASDYIPDSSSSYTDGTRDIFEYSYDYLTALTGDPVYYTYPANMEAGDDNQPYLKLVLPWYAYDKRDTSEDAAPVKQKEVYYKIALPLDALKEGNRMYEYKVHVDIIGSDTEVEIGATYSVKDWFHDKAISSNLATGKYISLDIPKDEYDMYSELTQIVFISSGDVDVIVDSIYQYNYSAATVTKDQFMRNNDVVATQDLRNAKGITTEEIEGWVTNPEGTSYLQISHAMDNDMTTATGAKNNAFDMAPYVFVITLHLTDAGEDKTFDRTITVTQYPSLFVKNRVSGGYVFINDYDYTDNYCLDNNNNRLGDIANRPGSLSGTGSNNNPNNYIITVSVLPKVEIIANVDAVIGDPRKLVVDNLTGLDITKYHPTLRTGTKGTIAPKFIVGSSYSALTSTKAVNLENAEKRCAAYQENGYPAGRWRVPTAAEIMFLAKLTKYNFIPSLFNFTNQSAGYWSANGKINGSGSGDPVLDETDTTSGGGIRCVYDAWYWGEEPVATGSAAQSWLGFKD